MVYIQFWGLPKNLCTYVVRTKWCTPCCGCCWPLACPPTIWKYKPLQYQYSKTPQSVFNNSLGRKVKHLTILGLHTNPTTHEKYNFLEETKPNPILLFHCRCVVDQHMHCHAIINIAINGKKVRKKQLKLGLHPLHISVHLFAYNVLAHFGK